MTTIKNIAIFGASGNFGTPILAALQHASHFNITILTRPDSQTAHPANTPLIRVDYADKAALTTVLKGQDAAICVLGPGGIRYQTGLVEAAYAAGVKRFVVDDFGWGPESDSLPEFDAVHASRTEGWNRARELAAGEGEAEAGFSWTGVTTGNPIDWALAKFPLMGFDARECSCTIYDEGDEAFTGTTLEGIGQAVLGVMLRPKETANRFVKVRSICTTQNELLAAFRTVTGREWSVQRSSTEALMVSGRGKLERGEAGWVLELVVAQLFDRGAGRCVVAATREESDAEGLGVREESAVDVVRKVMRIVEWA